jgi:predicted metal-dependent peptidase
VNRPFDHTKMAAARLWAVTRYPYLAAAVLATQTIERPGIRTVATDARFILYADGDVVHRMTTADLGRLIVHHVGHLLRQHADRAGDQPVPPELASMWTRACDAEINDDLPADDLLPAQLRTLPQAFGAEPGRFAEEYYAHLKSRHGPRWRWWSRETRLDCGSGADNRPRTWDEANGGVDEEAATLIRLKVAAATRDHAVTHPDQVGGNMLRWADRVVGVSVDWRRLLAAEIRKGANSRTGSSDYTNRRPSRRAATTPRVVLPSLHHPSPSLAVVCDTSGSMDQDLLNQALGQVEQILRSVTDRRTLLPVIACDTEVRAVRYINQVSQVELTGGGATNLTAGMAAAAELRPRPSIMIVLTDGATTWPARPPKNANVIIGLLGTPPPECPLPPWAKIIGIHRYPGATPTLA